MDRQPHLLSPTYSSSKFCRASLSLNLLLIAGLWTSSIPATEFQVVDGIPSYPVDAFLHGLQSGTGDLHQATFAARNLSRFLPDGTAASIEFETQNYYELIDPDGTRETLRDFKCVNGFSSLACLTLEPAGGESELPQLNPQAIGSRRISATGNTAMLTRSLSSSTIDIGDIATSHHYDPLYSGEVINARYANTADLGFGRDMHCLRQDATHVACYVSNYLPLDVDDVPVFDSPDGEDANAAALQDSSQLVATVAMEYSPIEGGGDDPVVKFYVYNANGDRVGSADLDGLGERPVPQLCMMCHGGNLKGTVDENGVAEFDRTADVKLDSKFLPFDLTTFTFPTIAGYTKADQQGAFKLLNEEIVLSTEPGKAIEEVVEKMYEHGTQTQIENFVIDGWDTDDVSRDFYRDVFAKSCRSCHIANTLKANKDLVPDQTGYPFRFRNQYDFVDRLGSIQALVCSARVMPHSLVTYNNFWATGQNELLDEFGETFGDDGNGWISGLCVNPERSINYNVDTAINSAIPSTSSFVRSIAVDTTFRDTIEPIFQNKCGWCHYPNNPDRPGASANGILQKGSIYSEISPLIESGGLLGLIDGDYARMPMNCVGKYCITNSEINAIEDWIDSGASNGLTFP